jgi:integrase
MLDQSSRDQRVDKIVTLTQGKSNPMPKLTQAALKRLIKIPGRHSDGAGLFFRVLPGEKAYFVYRFRIDGREREMSLGPYPETMLGEARDKHAVERVKVRQKVDPLAEKQAAKLTPAPSAVPTFGEIADDYVATHEGSWRNEKHRWQWRQTLTAYCAPIRSLPVDKVDTDAILRVLKPLWAAKQETAARLRGRIEKVLGAAKARGHIDRDKINPAMWRDNLEHLLSKRQKLMRGHHAAMPYADVPAFMARLQQSPGMAAKALMFAILTGARSGEVFGLTWGEIDLDHKVTAKGPDGKDQTIDMPLWTVPKERMKKSDNDHRVPLSPPAVDILRERMKERDENPFVFPSPIPQSAKVHRGSPHHPLSGMAFAMLLRRLGADDVTAHGFRSAFRDWVGEETTFQREIAEAALAHLVGDAVERAYRRGDALKKRLGLMNAWADYCFPSDKVVQVQFAGRAAGHERHPTSQAVG